MPCARNWRKNAAVISVRKNGGIRCCGKRNLEVTPPPVRKKEGATASWAKDYDQPLKDAGFSKVAENGIAGSYPPVKYTPQKGDVVVIQPIPGQNPAGHMAMYDGKQWISDFKQERQIWPNNSYQQRGADYKIYRHENRI